MWVMNEKKLLQVSDRLWYYPCQDDKDRPQLGLIRGDHFNVAVDAGHSVAHVREFYAALEGNGLALPSLTVLTHWHWDHTFGMHAVYGLTVSGQRTNEYLMQIAQQMRSGQMNAEAWKKMDAHIAAEYADNQQMVVVSADMSFSESLTIDAGGVHVCLMQTPSPHTDDSVLVYVPEERALFAGDCLCGAYPEWAVDAEKMQQLVVKLESINFELCFNGHWGLDSKEEILRELRAQIQ